METEFEYYLSITFF